MGSSNRYLAEIDEIVSNLRIISENSLQLRGKVLSGRSPMWSSKTQVNAENLKASLEALIYTEFYCRPAIGNITSGSDDDARKYLDQISDANNGLGSWDDNWQFLGFTAENKVRVQYNGVNFVASREKVNLPLDLVIYSPCKVFVPKELRRLIPGFYMAIGNRTFETTHNQPLRTVRFYWNVAFELSVEYIFSITTQLNRKSVPFKTKIVSHPRNFNRSDSAVLYIPKEFLPLAIPSIWQTYDRLKLRLRQAVPMFTFLVAPGLGVAEDPGDGNSFGQSRSKVIAEGLISAYEDGITSHNGVVKRVLDAFAKNNIDANFPYKALPSNFAPSEIMQSGPL